MDLFMIRHGHADSTGTGYTVDDEDPPLTPQGVRQAGFVAQRVAELDITHLYCGAMLRNLQTLAPIHAASGVPAVLIPAVFELGANLVAWPPETVMERFPMVTSAIPWAPWSREARESREECQARAAAVGAWLAERHGAADDRVALVSHGNLNAMMIGAFLGLPARDYIQFSSGNCCIHWLEIGPERVKLRKANDECHIPVAERT